MRPGVGLRGYCRRFSLVEFSLKSNFFFLDGKQRLSKIGGSRGGDGTTYTPPHPDTDGTSLTM